MSRRHLLFAFLILSASSLFVPVGRSQPQDTESQSVAGAAKRAKEAKKKASAKSKVITDDDLQSKKAKPGEEALSTPDVQVGTAPPATAGAGDAGETAKEKPPADASAQKTESPEVKRLKAELAQAEQDLDLAKRETALAQDSYYSKPDYTRDTAGRAKIDALKQHVAEKEKSVQDLKDRLAAMGVSLKPNDPAQPAPPTAPQS
jgi:hypothetical protein